MLSRNKTLALAVGTCALLGFGFQAARKTSSKDPLLAGYEIVTVAAVADAVDQITGQRGFMSHHPRKSHALSFYPRIHRHDRQR